MSKKISKAAKAEKALEVTTTSILKERGSRYGSFEGHAAITQQLKDFYRSCPGWANLTPDQREAMDMTAHKQGRFLNAGSDPNYEDSWRDVAGYNQLVADRLLGVTR